MRRAGNDLRLTAQLVGAASDEQFWAEKYSGTLGDAFELPESLARRIAEALQVTLSPAQERRRASPRNTEGDSVPKPGACEAEGFTWGRRAPGPPRVAQGPRL